MKGFVLKVAIFVMGMMFGISAYRGDLSKEPPLVAPNTVASASIFSPIAATPGWKKLSSKTYEYDFGLNIQSPKKYQALIKNLRNLSEDDTVILRLYNYGGSSISAINIYNAIMTTKAHVVADVSGPTFSAGAFITCGAKEIKMAPASFLMYHNGSISTMGEKFSDLRELINGLDKSYQLMMKECVRKGLLEEGDPQAIMDGKDVYVFSKSYPVRKND